MRAALLGAALLAAIPALAPGLAQTPVARPGNEIGTGQSLPLSAKPSNIGADTARSDIAPRLPLPEVGDDGAPAAFLHDAERAIAAGRSGEAQEAL